MKKLSKTPHNPKHYKPKNKIHKKIENLQNCLDDSWKEYNQLCDDLKKYSNRIVESDEEWEIALKIINDIHTKFVYEIAPVINYINMKHNFCTRAAEDYNQWMQTLKEAGLIQQEVKNDISGPEVNTIVKA